MKRREFVVLTGTALALPRAFAQAPGKVRRIGYLTPSAGSVQLDAIRAGLRELGYEEGKNFSLEIRSAEQSYRRLPDLADELVRLRPDLIIGSGTAATQALKGATTTLPILMIGAGDPVGSGLVASLARPGGNVTGVSNLSPPLGIKRLELLKEAQPRARRIGVLLNPANPAQGLSFRALEGAAAALKVELQDFEVRSLEDIRRAFGAMAKQRIDAVVLGNDSLLIANAAAIAELARKQRLPSAGNDEYARSGGLLGYGSIVAIHRYAANYVDKILKGAKPADLPVEQPSKFELIVNLKTAKALGIALQRSLLVRADEVIE